MWKRMRLSAGPACFLCIVALLIEPASIRTIAAEGGKGANRLNPVSANAATPMGGELAFVEMQQDGVGGVDGLDVAASVAASPDGNHVYVAGYADDAVAVFSRSVITGGLTFVETQQDGVGGVDGLDGATSIAISPDGRHVYVTGREDGAVAVLSRSVVTGGLTFVEMQKDGVGGVDGLNQAASVAVSPDGDHVYAVGYYDHAVAVFSRSVVTGGLTFVEVQKDGVGGVDGLAGTEWVTVSPDGNHVYVAG